MGALSARITTTARIMTVMAATMTKITAMITRGMATISAKERATVPETMAMDATMIGNRAGDNHCNDNAQGAARSARSQGNHPADDILVGTERTTATTESDPYADNFAYERDATLKDDCVPITYITAKSGENSHTFRKVLLDSGGTYSSIMRSSVPHSISLQSAKPKCLLSAADLTTHNQVVKFNTMKFPKFSAAITVNDVDLLVMHGHGQKSYDIIIGHNLMKELKLILTQKRSPSKIRSFPSTQETSQCTTPVSQMSLNPTVIVTAMMTSCRHLYDTGTPTPATTNLTTNLNPRKKAAIV